MVRYDIEENFQLMGSCGFREVSPGGLAAQFIADPGRVGYVISMPASRCRLKAWREVHMAHPELGQIRQNALRSLEREVRVQLQPIATDPFSAHD